MLQILHTVRATVTAVPVCCTEAVRVSSVALVISSCYSSTYAGMVIDISSSMMLPLLCTTGINSLRCTRYDIHRSLVLGIVCVPSHFTVPSVYATRRNPAQPIPILDSWRDSYQLFNPGEMQALSDWWM